VSHNIFVRCITFSATKRTSTSPLYIFVDLHIAANSAKVLSVTMENAKIGSLGSIAELQNIVYCSQHYKRN